MVSARQAARPAAAVTPAQKVDEAYTKKILDSTPDKRILTELVDHMPLPADPKVPSPLKFLGYVPGENNTVTYYKDIVRYLEALQAASPRVKMWSIGKSEEGRDMVAVAIADEATIRNLQRYKDITAQLTDPRQTNDEAAKQLIATGKPIYWATGSIHSGETGSVEMLMELAYRLAIEESPFIQQIRNNVIFVLTPTTEVDGHDRQVDNQRAVRAGQPQPSMVYWGKYVAHDNNRDGIGKGLKLSQNVLAAFLDMHPTVLHDLHESVNLLYVSTGTGPYNPIVDPIQVNEWWLLAQNECRNDRAACPACGPGYYDGGSNRDLDGVTHNPSAASRDAELSDAPGGGRRRGGGWVRRPGRRSSAAATPPAAAPPPAPDPTQCRSRLRKRRGRPRVPRLSPGNVPPSGSREWYRPFPNPGCVEWSAGQRQHAAERAAPDAQPGGEEQRSSRTTAPRTR